MSKIHELAFNAEEIDELLDSVDKKTIYQDATQSEHGLMSTTDKTKLDALPTAQQIDGALNAKVDKEAGKGLSKNDYTDADKAKVAFALQSETDPTVPSWAKQQNKPSYDYSEIGNTPDLSGFITKSVNDLTNYYLKSETYTKAEVSALIGAIQQFHYEIYATLPQTGQGNVLYLIGPIGSGSDRYEEYVYTNNAFTKIGDTSIDLSGYVTTSALNTALADYTTTASLTELLSGKQDTISDLAIIRSGAAIGATAYQKPSMGIPESDLSADVQSQLNKHFNGWYESLDELKAAHTATQGDSAYVKDASPATTWSIYVYDATASSDNNWIDSGTKADTSKVQTFASGEEVNEVHIVNDLTTGGTTDVLSAEQGKQLNTDKISKINVISEYVDVTATTTETGYINSSGSIITVLNYTVKTFPVISGNTYKITGQRAGSSSRLAAFYVSDGQGGLSLYNGTIQKVGSEGVGTEITNVKNPVPDGIPASSGQPGDVHTEVYIAPDTAVAIKIMATYSSIVCKELHTSTKHNQDVIDSVGDVADLTTDEKNTVVEAINEINGNVSKIKTVKILLVGSSHGMNTIAQFPWIAYKSGLNIEVGNVYIGSFSLQRLVGMNERGEKCTLKYFKDGTWTSYENKSFAQVFGYTDWDYIVVQRSASDDTIWLTTQAEADTERNSMTNINYNTELPAVYMSHNEALQYVLNLIRDNTLKQSCEVLFNSGFADPSEGIAQGTTENTSQTTNIISTAKDMKEQFGVDFVPVAIAIRNARNTFLRYIGKYTDTSNLNGRNQLCYDGQHLDYGIGCYVASMCLLQYICKKHNWSIVNLKGYGSQAEVGSFISTALTEGNYTEPTEETMMVAKACAMCACNTPEAVSTKLKSRFKWKITYSLGEGITASNSKGYCGNEDTYKTTLSGTVASVVITSRPWDRSQSATTLVEDTDYTYDSTTGEIVIASVEGDITITAS